MAAVIGAFTSIACCLPFGIAAALGAAGVGLALEPFRGWLIGLSVVLLAFGLWQLYRSKGTCQRSGYPRLLFWGSSCSLRRWRVSWPIGSLVLPRPLRHIWSNSAAWTFSRTSSIVLRVRPVSLCCFPPPDQLVCGGPPRFNKFWIGALTAL